MAIQTVMCGNPCCDPAEHYTALFVADSGLEFRLPFDRKVVDGEVVVEQTITGLPVAVYTLFEVETGPQDWKGRLIPSECTVAQFVAMLPEECAVKWMAMGNRIRQ